MLPKTTYHATGQVAFDMLYAKHPTSAILHAHSLPKKGAAAISKQEDIPITLDIATTDFAPNLLTKPDAGIIRSIEAIATYPVEDITVDLSAPSIAKYSMRIALLSTITSEKQPKNVENNA